MFQGILSNESANRQNGVVKIAVIGSAAYPPSVVIVSAQGGDRGVLRQSR